MDSSVKYSLYLLIILLVAGCTGEKADFIDRMEMEHENDQPVANAAAEIEQNSEVATETVTYATVDGKEITGYFAEPEDAEGDLPGLIVIHEWWGLNDNIRMMTRRLAGQGYRALAVDLYQGEVAETSDKASTLARSVNQGQAVSNLEQAYSYLTEQKNASKVGTIGWCFGGGWSLQTALAMPEKIDATVIYYGRLVTDAKQLMKLDMPILGLFGEEDRGIPPSQVREFESTLKTLNKTVNVYIYENAGHAFANPSGNRYNEKAAEDAWKKTVVFFEKHLK